MKEMVEKAMLLS